MVIVNYATSLAHPAPPMNGRQNDMQDDDAADIAGVGIPPPVLYGGALILGIALGRGTENDVRGKRLARVTGMLSLAAGVAIGAATTAELKRAGTNLSPYRPTTALVTRGVFRFSRNPAYVAATSLYLGGALLARSLPALEFLPIVLALLDHHVVDREERYLERLFGDEYRAYSARVPRWF
jgi:protein-S-isoprenylcysteine O-methyltransferase Ste14